jgi:hypothetical protein
MIAKKRTYTRERVTVRAYSVHRTQHWREPGRDRPRQPQYREAVSCDLTCQSCIPMHIHGIKIIPTVSEFAFDPMLKALIMPPYGSPRERFLNTIPFRPQPACKSDTDDERKRCLP